MTKFLLSALTVVAVQANASSILYFGTESAAQKKNEYCNYSFSVPQVLAAPGSTPKTQAVAAALNGKWKAELATAVAAYNTGSLDSECTDTMSSYQESSSFVIATDLESTIVSIVTSTYSYYGGAHGGYGEEGSTFNAKTGEFYTSVADFFTDSKRAVFLSKLREKLKEQNPNLDPTFGLDDWEKGVKTLYDVQNYYFTSEGLTIYFNPYAIGSYAEGLIKAKFYWWELADMGLRSEGPATELKKNFDF